MLLEHVGLADDDARLDAAVTAVDAAGAVLPADQGGTSSTTAFADAVVAALEA